MRNDPVMTETVCLVESKEMVQTKIGKKDSSRKCLARKNPVLLSVDEHYDLILLFAVLDNV